MVSATSPHHPPLSLPSSASPLPAPFPQHRHLLRIFPASNKIRKPNRKPKSLTPPSVERVPPAFSLKEKSTLVDSQPSLNPLLLGSCFHCSCLLTIQQRNEEAAPTKVTDGLGDAKSRGRLSVLIYLSTLQLSHCAGPGHLTLSVTALLGLLFLRGPLVLVSPQGLLNDPSPSPLLRPESTLSP